MDRVIYADCFIPVHYYPCEIALYCASLSEVYKPAVINLQELNPVTPFSGRNECFDS
jgi:hypothetical protein